MADDERTSLAALAITADTSLLMKQADIAATLKNYWSKMSPNAQNAAIGAGLGAGAGLMRSATSSDKDKHWRRNALLGALMGGGLGASVNPLLKSLSPAPVAAAVTPQPRQVSDKPILMPLTGEGQGGSSAAVSEPATTPSRLPGPWVQIPQRVLPPPPSRELVRDDSWLSHGATIGAGAVAGPAVTFAANRIADAQDLDEVVRGLAKNPYLRSDPAEEAYKIMKPRKMTRGDLLRSGLTGAALGELFYRLQPE